MRPTKAQIRAMSTTVGTLLFTLVSILVIAPMNDGRVVNQVVAAE